MKLASAVPPVFAVVEDTAYEPDTIGFDPNAFAQTLPGITAPLGFFDPAGFCASSSGAEGEATEGKVRFYREVELKHGRVAMLAALGFPLAEQFHPLFGGNIDVPSFSAFQQTPLQTFWPAVVLAIAVIEVFSIIPAFENPNVEGWAIRSDHVAGDFGFDPLGLKPTTAAELYDMQTKELNNGRYVSRGLNLGILAFRHALLTSRLRSLLFEQAGDDRDCRHGGAGGHHWWQALLGNARGFGCFEHWNIPT